MIYFSGFWLYSSDPEIQWGASENRRRTSGSASKTWVPSTTHLCPCSNQMSFTCMHFYILGLHISFGKRSLKTSKPNNFQILTRSPSIHIRCLLSAIIHNILIETTLVTHTKTQDHLNSLIFLFLHIQSITRSWYSSLLIFIPFPHFQS